ncbi:acyl-CoA dehydrogenase family protein [Rhizobium sp. 18055]|uniref:acyl-CoA dehydrogenase family protein n=1 Tax=Rhizobium sp. 18055 TaxID=2681403 RepID=UPI00135A4F5A|nr:acyl-CoA dehydrogenase family protein [Rhizobium sp. 18055]
MPMEAIPSIETLLERAVALRPMLHEQQAACEERSYPSRDVYEAFKANGFFRVVTPKIYGGFEKSLRDYYSLVIEIARGCPSTGWWFALGATHAVQISSYCAPETQRKVFAFDPDFSGPWTWTAPNATIIKENGGYRLSGTWHFASGGPHSSFMMAGLTVPVEGFGENSKVTALVPRGSYEILNDWGDVIGVRGSGSNSVRIDNIFVPDDMLPCRAAIFISRTPCLPFPERKRSTRQKRS